MRRDRKPLEDNLPSRMRFGEAIELGLKLDCYHPEGDLYYIDTEAHRLVYRADKIRNYVMRVGRRKIAKKR